MSIQKENEQIKRRELESPTFKHQSNRGWSTEETEKEWARR